MPLLTLALVLVSVGMICTGQLLFKLVGLRLQAGIPILDYRVLSVAGISIVIYGLATLLWIYVLKTTPLTKAYPYMALSFVLIPIASVVLYSEQVRPMYVLGTALIVAGVLLTSISSN